MQLMRHTFPSVVDSKNTNYYEEVSPPPLAPPQKGRAFRSSVTVPSPEDAEVSQSGLAGRW